jgi:hypothetical protein
MTVLHHEGAWDAGITPGLGRVILERGVLANQPPTAHGVRELHQLGAQL